MSEPFYDGVSPADGLWLGYGDAVVSVLLITLLLTLAQTLLFFGANCISWIRRDERLSSGNKVR